MLFGRVAVSFVYALRSFVSFACSLGELQFRWFCFEVICFSPGWGAERVRAPAEAGLPIANHCLELGVCHLGTWLEGLRRRKRKLECPSPQPRVRLWENVIAYNEKPVARENARTGIEFIGPSSARSVALPSPIPTTVDVLIPLLPHRFHQMFGSPCQRRDGERMQEDRRMRTSTIVGMGFGGAAPLEGPSI